MSLRKSEILNSVKRMKRILYGMIASYCLFSGLVEAEQEGATHSNFEEQSNKQASSAQDISDILETIAIKHHIPAMAGLVIKGDETVMQGITGVRKRGANVKATLDDLWHLGSCTKAMTATLCAILVDKEFLKWDSTLEDIFPEVAKKMHPEFRKVTLSQLLTNRAGFPGDLLQWKDLWDDLWHFKGTPKQARGYLLEKITAKKPETKPGTKDVYSNAGFAVAGHIAETVMGKEYEVLMQEYLFNPLNMKSVGWGTPGTWEGSGNQTLKEPWGHEKDGSPVKPLKNTPDGKGSDNPIGIAPAGRLHCTIQDWARFISIHLRGNEMNPSMECKLLTSETFKKLQTPPDTLSDYAYGWMCIERAWAGSQKEGEVLTHAGSNTMWYCVTWIAPKKDFAVLICSNMAGPMVEKGADEACWALIQKQLESDKKK